MEKLLKTFINKNKKIVLIVLISVFIIIFFVLIKKKNVHASDDIDVIEDIEIVEDIEVMKELEEPSEQPTLDIIQIEKVKVDIKGEVLNPGVYELEYGKRIIDVVNLSGGFTKKAVTRNVNLSKKIYDEMVITIPDESTTCEFIPTYNVEEPNNTQNKNNLININTASYDELLTITGIGETKARQIIEYRVTNGGFTRIEDIMNIPGIKESAFDKLKNEITV